LEREEHKAAIEHYSFGGVRTFPLIGLLGYSLALLSGPQLLPLTLGLAVVGAFLLLSYRHKLQTNETAGVTTEMSGLTTYVVGALVYHEQFWIATTLSVASMLLLELKVVLESLTKRIASDEILTFTKFLVLTAVILPVVPNQEIGPYQINPFKTWLVVVAVSTVSYGSYVLQEVTKNQGGVILTAILGGTYSSTVTTVALARRAAREQHCHLFAGGILVASGMMYLRLIALVALFNRDSNSRPGFRRRQAGICAQKSTGAARGFPVCASVLSHAGSHPACSHLFGKGRRVLAGRRHGGCRCRSVSYGHDPVDGHSHECTGRGFRNSDCCRQQ
jgi:hypothetical protein